jgi:hypothetical protein
MMVYLYNIFQKERNKIMTLKEIGNYIFKTLETENESLNLENNIFKLEKIKKNQFLLSRTDSKTKIEIHLSRKKITLILISKTGFKPQKDKFLNYPVVDVLWDIDDEFGWRRFEEEFDFYEDDDDAKILISDFLL